MDIFKQDIANPFDKKLYKYTDNTFEKSSYYRLKIVNTDGTVEYSKIIFLQKSNIFSEFKMYPNPVADVLNVYSEQAGDYEFPLKISITDLLGKKCYEEIILDENSPPLLRQIDTQNLAKGSYTIKINSENQVYFIQKFIKN
ncbi:MAG: T9SS type A sorting domain-containing protein [Saprospiraceae bacterium]|nr:T9SS type A sorting domain-containing protein [Saprospiraceae bacterium]